MLGTTRLQWGRTGEGPEITGRLVTRICPVGLQWGRTGEGPEMGGQAGVVGKEGKLQWGRTGEGPEMTWLVQGIMGI